MGIESFSSGKNERPEAGAKERLSNEERKLLISDATDRVLKNSNEITPVFIQQAVDSELQYYKRYDVSPEEVIHDVNVQLDNIPEHKRWPALTEYLKTYRLKREGSL